MIKQLQIIMGSLNEILMNIGKPGIVFRKSVIGSLTKFHTISNVNIYFLQYYELKLNYSINRG